MNLQEVHISLEGDVDFKVLKAYRQVAPQVYHALLITRFIGQAGEGSGGNANSSFLKTVTAASVGLNLYDAVLFDLTALDYTFGDSFAAVLEVPHSVKGTELPVGIVVSDKCEKGIRSLLTYIQKQQLYRIYDSFEQGVEKLLDYVSEKNARG